MTDKAAFQDVFQQYAKLASDDTLTEAEKTGRYSFHEISFDSIAKDISKKLDLRPDLSLLDVGSGAGDITFRLSPAPRRITLNDHAEVLKRVKNLSQRQSIEIHAGNLLELDSCLGPFDRILCYSVLPILPEHAVFPAIDKLVGLLSIGGKLLIGDLPNIDKKERFEISRESKRVSIKKEFEAKRSSLASVDPVNSHERHFLFNDINNLKLISYLRQKHCEAYLLPQPLELPFGCTREDILVVRL